jgi:hypothetical protein
MISYITEKGRMNAVESFDAELVERVIYLRREDIIKLLHSDSEALKPLGESTAIIDMGKEVERNIYKNEKRVFAKAPSFSPSYILEVV